MFWCGMNREIYRNFLLHTKPSIRTSLSFSLSFTLVSSSLTHSLIFLSFHPISRRLNPSLYSFLSPYLFFHFSLVGFSLKWGGRRLYSQLNLLPYISSLLLLLIPCFPYTDISLYYYHLPKEGRKRTCLCIPILSYLFVRPFSWLFAYIVYSLPPLVSIPFISFFSSLDSFSLLSRGGNGVRSECLSISIHPIPFNSFIRIFNFFSHFTCFDV